MKNNAAFYIKHFHLIPHPEGGWYKETYKASESIDRKALPERFTGSRSFSTAIYYLLEKGTFSAFHRLKSDELFHFYAGDSMEIITISPEGKLKTIELGPHADKGEVFHYAIPTGYWFAARLKEKSEFALMGCTVAPGFDFEDFEMADRDSLIFEFPQHSQIIVELTRF